jgi:hypothetical protein
VVAGNLGIFNKGEDMDDRKLLELAAKAAGIHRKYYEYLGDCGMIDDDPETGWWNPLTDDADALRLAVKLKRDVIFTGPNSSLTHVYARSPYGFHYCHLPLGDDPQAAYRRVIVTSAAMEGEQMP